MTESPSLRTARLAAKAANPKLSVNFRGIPDDGADKLRWAEVHRTLSGYNCWDAMLVCSLLVNAVISPRLEAAYKMKSSALRIISSHEYADVFDDLTVPVLNATQLVQDVAIGSFLGFFRGNTLMHAMIYTENGYGAGTANDCIFREAKPGWGSVNLCDFFTPGPASAGIVMKARPVEGQRF